MRQLSVALGLMISLLFPFCMFAQNCDKGALLYENKLATEADIAGWQMEGPGVTSFKEGWMHMQSPDEAGHHVFWCPTDFPENFVAEWDVQNNHPQAGLCIIFFAAKGLNGEDALSPTLPKRTGSFKQYTKGAINNYHISYYANGENQPERATANLRKNKGFKKVQTGEEGIPVNSAAVHTVRLTKYQGHIQLHIDGRLVIDWVDEGNINGAPLADGKMGFRQMKWTHFAYRNFKVWEAVPANN